MGVGGESGLVTLEWITIIGAVAALAGVAFYLVWATTADDAADIAGSDHFPGAVLAAVHITEDARAALPLLADAAVVAEVNDEYGRQCRRLQIAYLDIDLRARWVDADAALGDRFDTFAGVANAPPRALCVVATGGVEPLVPLDPGLRSGPGVVVEDAVGTEGEVLHFTVRLSAPSARTVAVDYRTFNSPPRVGIAASGLDYGAVSGSLTFGPGVTTRTVAVVLRVDGVSEVDETFELRLDNPRRATIQDGRGLGTIRDAPAQELRISGASVTEGGSLAFEVGLGGAAALENVSVAFETVARVSGAGAADPVLDYLSRSGTVTIFKGQSSALVHVATLDDRLDEAPESLVMRLRDPVGAVLVVAEATGTILDDDDPPLLEVFGADALESDGLLWFELRLSTASGREVTARVDTADGSATAPDDYSALSGSSVVVAAGDTFTLVPVALVDDTVAESFETFTLALSNVQYARLGGSVAEGRIIDDDSGPTVLIGDSALVVEGDTAILAVRLSEAAAEEVVVSYETADGSAVAPGDYISQVGWVTFQAGETSATVQVATVDDAVEGEPDEAFEVNLTGVTGGGASIGDGSGLGWILDNDVIPEISVDDTRAREDGAAVFRVRLNRPTSRPVTVDWTSTLHPSATHRAVAPNDFALVSGRLTFPPGEVLATVSVPLVVDGLDEYDEEFWLRLGGAVGGTIADGTATGVIEDIDPEPALELRPAEAIEGDYLIFGLHLDAVSGRTITASYTTDDTIANTDALAGEDYVTAAGTLTIRPGTPAVTVTVQSLDDQLPEPSETFALRLGRTTNARIDTGMVLGTIHDNDLLPNLLVGDLRVTEGADPAAVFVVELDRPSTEEVTFDYATIAGTARPATACDDQSDGSFDYLTATGSVTIPAGDTETTISVTVCDDIGVEPDEDFILRLANVAEAHLIDASGAVATILDDDSVPRVSVADAVAFEADGTIGFEVTLSHESAEVVLVDYSTFDGTATQPADYLPGRGQLTIDPGETSATIAVSLVDDVFSEVPAAESFSIVLSLPDPAIATLVDGDATGVIHDDDESPVAFVYEARANEDDGTVIVRVELDKPHNKEIRIPYRSEPFCAAWPPGSIDHRINCDTKVDLVLNVDFELTPGELVLPAGSTAATITVTLIDDNEVNRQLTSHGRIVLNNQPVEDCAEHQRRRYVPDCGVLIVRDDEQPAKVRFSNIFSTPQLEGAGTIRLFVDLNDFVVDEDITVTYRTDTTPARPLHYGAEPATAAVDYVVVNSGSVTIPAGSRVSSFEIDILDDDDIESSEMFTVTLTGVTEGHAAVSPGLSALGWILDDDTALTITATGASVTESSPVMEFNLALNRASTTAVTVDYRTTAAGTATAGEDYTSASGSVDIPAGHEVATISVPLLDDDDIEEDETIQLAFSNATGAQLTATTVVGTIVDDDGTGLPIVTIDDAARFEDSTTWSSQVLEFYVDIWLSEIPTEDVTVKYTILEAPWLGEYAATYFDDFSYNHHYSTIEDGVRVWSRTYRADRQEQHNDVSIIIYDDDLPERDERFMIRLLEVEKARIGDDTGWVTILNNDRSIVTVEDVTVAEGAGSATFTLKLHEPSFDPASVRYSTAAWPWSAEQAATVGEDYTEIDNALVTIPAGDTTATITVPILADTKDEYDEVFVLRLHDPVLLELTETLVIATITDDDPGWWIGDTGGSETAGTVEFKVLRDPPVTAPITLQYEVADGGAIGGNSCSDTGVDYLTPTGSLAFPAGVTEATISVTICDDAVAEGAETFLVELLNVTGRRTTATGTITSSD